MKIAIEGENPVRIGSRGDLAKLLPVRIDGEVLNFEHGEGRVRVGKTIWGLYVGDNGKQYLQYEKGQCDWNELQGITNEIHQKLAGEFGAGVKFSVEGCLVHTRDDDRYL